MFLTVSGTHINNIEKLPDISDFVYTLVLEIQDGYFFLFIHVIDAILRDYFIL